MALGGAIAGNLFDHLNWLHVLSALLIIFIVRPLAGITALIGLKKVPWREKLAISFFGIRGIGSIYYLSYALNKHAFEGAEELFALVVLIIAISIFLHGVLSTPITNHLDMLRERRK